MSVLRPHRVAVALAALFTLPAMAGSVTSKDSDIVIDTNSGLEIKTIDEAFSFKLGGKIQFDITNFDGLAAGSQADHFTAATDAYIRRGTLSMEGTAYSDWHYGVRFNYDGQEGGTDVDRAWIGYSGFSVGDIKIGEYRVNYGLEGATRSAWTTGMERPAMYDLLEGDEDTRAGISLTHVGSNYTLMAQVASQGDKPVDGASEVYGYTMRATYAPIMTPNQVLHIGVNYHNANPDHNETELKSRFGIRSNADDKMRFIDIADTRSDHEYLISAVYQLNGLRLQSEYFNRSTRGFDEDMENAYSDADGYYAQVSYMFDSSREYDLADGKWKKPTSFGSYEIMARFEQTHIDNNKAASKKNINNNIDGITAVDRNQGHDANSMVLGVNYFANKQVRVSLNYIRYQLDNIDTSESIDEQAVENDSHAITARLQYHF